MNGKNYITTNMNTPIYKHRFNMNINKHKSNTIYDIALDILETSIEIWVYCFQTLYFQFAQVGQSSIIENNVTTKQMPIFWFARKSSTKNFGTPFETSFEFQNWKCIQHSSDWMKPKFRSDDFWPTSQTVAIEKLKKEMIEVLAAGYPPCGWSVLVPGTTPIFGIQDKPWKS